MIISRKTSRQLIVRRCFCVEARNVPPPCLVSIRPNNFKLRNASLTEDRPTPRRSEMTHSEGYFSPACILSYRNCWTISKNTFFCSVFLSIRSTSRSIAFAQINIRPKVLSSFSRCLDTYYKERKSTTFRGWWLLLNEYKKWSDHFLYFKLSYKIVI